MISTILLLLLLALVLYAVYRLLHRSALRVECNPKGRVAPLVDAMQTLKAPFRPTPWLIGPHLQTVYGMRFRRRHPLIAKCRREEFVLSDGGTSALDFFEPADARDGCPLVVIAHTLGGGTREPCVSNFAATCAARGWRAVVMNGRGCSGARFTSARIPSALDYDDLSEVIEHLRAALRPSHVFLAGFSLGALQSMGYSARVGRVDAIAAVSHTYNSARGVEVLERPVAMRLYQPVIMRQLHRAIEKDTFIEAPAALASRTMREFDEAFTARAKGFATAREYYKETDIYANIAGARVPTLVLGADDDPFTSPEVLPIEESRKSENVVFVHTEEGGHVSFIKGIDASKSLIDEVLPEWFQVVLDSQKKNE